ncbi:MAG TPA: hypothetical protein ENI52_04645 [Thermoplasmata archaeon]|nr:hypothetical protein [Thermoplasmata archaeon]
MEEEEIIDLVRKHEKFKLSGINLVASENRISKIALKILASDLSGRYGNEWYGGSQYSLEICECVKKKIEKLFGVKYSLITPVSGNICDLAVIFSFTKCGDEVAGISKKDGGYPLGYHKFERKFYSLPTKYYSIDENKMQKINRDFPLTLIASSICPFPHPVEKISKKFSGTIVYDASHVLGLIAGKKFQLPLKEGCHVMIGSTHKSFPGPQGGIVLTNIKEMAEKLSEYLHFEFENGIGLVDNPHLNRIACLGFVTEELIKKGREYAVQTVKNAKFLAESLYELNVPVKFAEKGFTESHQVLLELNGVKSNKFYKLLEKNHIFIDCIGRIGVAEATYIGMKEEEMNEIAHMIADVYKGKDVKKKAVKMAKKFYT